jgi:hypothetical protein
MGIEWHLDIKALPAEEREQWNAMLKTDAYELQRLGGLYGLPDNS